MFALLDAHSSRSTALPVHWAPSQHIQAPSSCTTASHQQPLLSVLDALAAPTVFMQQALVFNKAINATDLASALQLVLQGYPALGYGLSKDQDGRLCLCPPPCQAAAGITILQGTSSSTLQQLLQHSGMASSCHTAEPNTTPGQTAQQQQQLMQKSELSNAQEQQQVQQQQQMQKSELLTIPKQQQVQQQLVKLPELPDALFGHLPGALLPAYLDNPKLPLVHVALVDLSGGGCVLGMRMSHLMGDWSSARLLLRSIAAAYSHIQQATRLSSAVEAHLDALNTKSSATAATAVQLHPAASGSSSSSNLSNDVSHLPQLTAAAPLLNRLVAATRQQLPTGFEPVRLKLQQPQDVALFQQLAQLSSRNSSSCGKDEHDGRAGSSSNSGQPQRLTHHVLPDRIEQLKQRAQADLAAAAAAAAAAGGTADGSSSRRACTSHNVLLARLLQAYCSLPGCAGVPHDVAVSVDMRGKLPLQQQQQELYTAFGNFFASAILEDALPERSSLGELAMQLRAAVERARALWLPDLAWASGVIGVTDAALTGCDGNQTHQQQQQQQEEEAEQTTYTQQPGAANIEEQQQQQQVTWRRLHAMGPRRLLQQQTQLGLLASLSTTQWPLDYPVDANFAGHLPLLAVPSFSQPQPYPLLLMQQAPPGCGGGLLLHVWLDGEEVVLLQQAVAANGGL